MRISSKTLLGLMLQQGGAKARTGALARSSGSAGRSRGKAGFLNRRLGSVGQTGGIAQVAAHPLGGAFMCSTLRLLLASQKRLVGLLSFCILLFILLTLHLLIGGYFQSLLVSLYSVAQGDIRPGASTPVGLPRRLSSKESTCNS